MPRRQEPHATALIIDRAAAAETPSVESIREWARDKRVFISSVMSELAKERQAVARAIRKVGARPVMFEEFGGRDADPENAYLGEVDTADIYIGILGRRYGKQLNTRYSATHTEFSHAEQRGLRIAIWALRADDREGHEQSFFDDLREVYTVPEFTTSEELERQVEERLTTIAAQDLSPWCKLGDVVFRANEIAARTDRITVTAQVRSGDVAHALESMQPDRWNRGEPIRFTWPSSSRHVTVKGGESITRTTKSKQLRLSLETAEPPRDTMLDVTFESYTPDDQTEIGLRHVLFGEPNPLAKKYVGFAMEMPDPLHPLREAQVSEEILRPLAELLIVDALVGAGRAARVTECRLGVPFRGMRDLQLAWEPRKQHSDERSQRRSIRGKVRL